MDLYWYGYYIMWLYIPITDTTGQAYTIITSLLMDVLMKDKKKNQKKKKPTATKTTALMK